MKKEEKKEKRGGGEGKGTPHVMVFCSHDNESYKCNLFFFYNISPLFRSAPFDRPSFC